MAVKDLIGGKKVKGGEIVSRILAAEGVEKVFGIIDGTYFGMYATFEENGITLLTPRHEASAVHMAGAFARLTGRLGVCMASNGPGVANVLPGVAVEHVEGNRVLLITSWRRDGISGPDRGGSYQCFPQVEVTKPISKWSCAVPSVERLAEILRRAIRISYSGRPGIVHVDIPEDLMNAEFKANPDWFRPPEQYRATLPTPPTAADVEGALELLVGAERPMIHAGSGVVHAQAFERVAELAKTLHAPICTSWGARCAVDERSELAVPMFHIEVNNRVRNQADVVLVLGSRLGETDWWGKPPYWGAPDKLKMIQVDSDPHTLGNTRRAELLVQADINVFLDSLLEALRSRGPASSADSRREWVAGVRDAVVKSRTELDKHLEDLSIPMISAHVATVCRRVFPEESTFILDGGNTAIWANFYHEVQTPGRLLGTPKMGHLGAGVPQAVGAAAALPEAPVCCIIGDGAMGFNQQEVETAVRYGLPVVYVVLCDRQWGMVKMTQQFQLKPLKTLVMKSLGPDETINTDLSETRFDDLGRAMGAYGERTSDPQGLEGAVRRCLATGRCSVIHVDVDPVKHMWAPGLRYFKDMHQEPAG